MPDPLKRLFIALFVLLAITVSGQNVELPPDLRQHTLTNYNSSLLNPVFSLDRNNPQSIAFWSRWQWQTIDGDPTTIFLNYTRQLNSESAAGLGFFQHNTGVYLQSGGVLNYAYGLQLENDAMISFGLNLYAYQRKLADERFMMNPGLPPLPDTNDFIMQLAPGLQFTISQFSIGIAAENLFDYNFSASEKVSGPREKIYIGHASYDIPLESGGFLEDMLLRPVVYLKSIPGYDNQFGVNAHFSSSKFWVQGGYNSFYGPSGGLGGRFFKKFTLGALVEFGTGSDLDGLDPTFEIAAAFDIIPKEKKEPTPEPEEEPVEPEEEITEEAGPTEEELALQAEEERRAEEARLAREAFVRDSIDAARLAEAEAARKLAEEQREAEKAQPREGERYQESVSEDGLQPGFYLVANVFGTKRYYEGFMKTLADMGLEPKSFYRSVNKYNYVYLKRYDTMQEARRARDSQYNGRYKGETWIYRVLPK